MYINLKLDDSEVACLEAGKLAVGIKANSDYLRYLIVTTGNKDVCAQFKNDDKNQG